MSTDALVNTLSKLLVLHKSLLLLAKQKTEIIKAGDMDSLNNIIKEELKHVQAIKKIDKERENITKNIPFDDLINEITDQKYKNKLEQLKNDLMAELDQLKKQNDLNHQLIEQSLQFVNISLDLLLPDTEAIDYSLNGKIDNELTRISTFDSKA